MALKLFVGNLPFSTTSADLTTHFSRIGAVKEVKIVMNREDNRPRGIAFVTMTNEGDAARAMVELNNSDIGGRRIVVSEAHERPASGGRPPFRREATQHSAPPAFNIPSAPAEYSPPRRTFVPSNDFFDAPSPAPSQGRRRSNDRRRNDRYEDDRF
jgi:RNA recognition motif-containing protein